MKKRPQLPRRIGAGGIRLIDLPGVVYPETVVKPPKKATHVAEPLPIPQGFVSSQQAADMLGITPRSARAMLARRRIRSMLVSQPSGGLCRFWSRRGVEEVLEQRVPMVESMPERLCPAAEACYILMVARSTLFRYVQQGLLREHRVRVSDASGVHLRCYFQRSAVRRLAALIAAARARSEETRRQSHAERWQDFCNRSTTPPDQPQR